MVQTRQGKKRLVKTGKLKVSTIIVDIDSVGIITASSTSGDTNNSNLLCSHLQHLWIS